MPLRSLSVPTRSSQANRHQIGELATRHAIPAIYYDRDFAAAGGLSYGVSIRNRPGGNIMGITGVSNLGVELGQ